MKIPICLPQDASPKDFIACPDCCSIECRKHGFYFRSAFHFRGTSMIGKPIAVQRFCCLNPECPRWTFSILPIFSLRISRFFWPCLLAIHNAISAGSTRCAVASDWGVDRRTIRRALAQFGKIVDWINGLYQELSDGKPLREIALMVKIITAKLSRCELVHRWYRHRYSRRSLLTNPVATQSGSFL